jgi:hypothetical protein
VTCRELRQACDHRCRTCLLQSSANAGTCHLMPFPLLTSVHRRGRQRWLNAVVSIFRHSFRVMTVDPPLPGIPGARRRAVTVRRVEGEHTEART